MDMRVFIHIVLVLFMCTAALFGENIQHTVAKGDTLYSLAKKYGVTVDEIRSANSMSGNDLYAGQKLTIPVKTQPRQITYESYTVKAGDTLYSIARRHEISVEELREINGLSSSSVLKTNSNSLCVSAMISRLKISPTMAFFGIFVALRIISFAFTLS